MPTEKPAKALTPRERLAELRAAEAAEALTPTRPAVVTVPLPEEVDVPGDPVLAVRAPQQQVEAQIDGTDAYAEPEEVAAWKLEQALLHAVVTDSTERDLLDVHVGPDIRGGYFQHRDKTPINLEPEWVRCTDPVEALALKTHLTKLRADLGLTRPEGSLRRMPTLQDQR